MHGLWSGDLARNLVTFVRYDGRVISFGVANGWQPPTEFSAREMSGNHQVRYQNPEFCDLQRT